MNVGVVLMIGSVAGVLLLRIARVRSCVLVALLVVAFIYGLGLVTA